MVPVAIKLLASGASRRPGRITKLDALPTDQERIRTLKIISLVFIGFFASVLSGLLGIGGGAILIPAMVYLLGMNQHRAHGTSLAVISLVVLSSAILYSKHGLVDWTVAVELMVGGVIGATIGARICNRISAGKLKRLFGVFMALVGLRMLYGAAFASGAASEIAGYAISAYTVGGGVVVFLIGLVTGVISGLFGIGGGLIMVPILTLVMGMGQKAAQGISLAVIVPVSISGALIHQGHGNVRWNIAFWLAVGGVLGGLAGAHVAVVKIPDAVLKGMFGLLMLVMGMLMFRHAKPTCS